MSGRNRSTNGKLLARIAFQFCLPASPSISGMQMPRLVATSQSLTLPSSFTNPFPRSLHSVLIDGGLPKWSRETPESS